MAVLAASGSAEIVSCYSSTDLYNWDDRGLIIPPDTSEADYVWLPIRFDGDMPVIDWRDEWCIEDYA